ncbi:hypothetical protein, partial [Xylanibacter rodentium]|uniref:hypothetical protein n=1 Tax=Xylanibacter rodentium TaxID=2736289 RepID=UPI002584A8C5
MIQHVEIREIKDEGALKRQQAHSPGQSVAAPRESNIDNPRALKGQKHKNIWNVKKCKYLIINAFALSGRMY